MDDKTGQPHTSHTLSPVPVILVNPPPGVSGLRNGVLADVAPTLVEGQSFDRQRKIRNKTSFDYKRKPLPEQKIH